MLFAGFALRPIPPWLLQPALDRGLRHVLDRHPDLFERLADLDRPRYRIDVTDLPFGFVLDVAPERLTLVRRPELVDVAATATIRAPLLTLLELMQGRLDGDALFFSRDLVVEGDTEAVVALRNAIDGAGIDLIEEAMGVLGPLAGPLRAVLERAQRVFDAAASDLETVRQAALAPLARRREADRARLEDLERKVAELSRRRKREERA